MWEYAHGGCYTVDYHVFMIPWAVEEFKDKEYRRAYAESFANTVIATQIRLLRGPMTQKDFATLVGVKQSRISAMEDENYSMWSTKTLKRLAAAKDVVFLGRFVSFGELLNSSDVMSEQSLTVRPFSEDPAFTGNVHMTTVTTQVGTVNFVPVGIATATTTVFTNTTVQQTVRQANLFTLRLVQPSKTELAA